MRAQIDVIIEQLPPIIFTSLASGEIDYYGASHLLANSLGLKGVPYTRASWLHGWITYSMISPDLFVTQESVSCCEVTKVPNLVANKSQEYFLQQNGYPNACAVGLPFLYTHNTSVKRLPNSLLIIPAHSIKENNINYEKGRNCLFPEETRTLREKYSLTAACIGGFCVQKKNYLAAYEEAGIPWITGAWLHDLNALQRMRNLLSHFEFVATNSIGSHIPYAMLCGCKVSYYGEGYNRKRQDYEKVPVYQNHPELIDIVMEEGKHQKLKKHFPFLFDNTEPTEGLVKWAEQILGVEHQIPAYEIAKLIGWKIRPKDDTSWEYIPEENPGLQ